jgi:tRNA(Ile2) C34 agmatinyltransferase TiaS
VKGTIQKTVAKVTDPTNGPSCGVRVWGKGGLVNLSCKKCDVDFEQEAGPENDKDGEEGE